MVDQQHDQLYPGFSNPSDVFSPEEMETGNSKQKVRICY